MSAVGSSVRIRRAAGARRLTALVNGENEVARAFWEAAGFQCYAGMVRYAKNA